MQCDCCTGEAFTKAGRDRRGRQLWACAQCRRRRTARSASAFSGYRFPDDIIALAVRWYLRFRLSYADVAEWLAERGIIVDRTIIYDWVHTFTLQFITAARKHRHPDRPQVARGRDVPQDRRATTLPVPRHRRVWSDHRCPAERAS